MVSTRYAPTPCLAERKLTFISQNCNRFFTRVVELDEENGAPEAPVSAGQAHDARFAESSSKRGNGRNNADSGDEKHSRNKSKRTSQEPESDSDNEDVRGFVRVTLVSKQRAIEVVSLPTESSHATSSDGEVEFEVKERFPDDYVESSSSSDDDDDDAYEEATQETVENGKLVATEADARKHRIPHGYSLKNWNPTEEPFLVLGSVFDANSVGKWISDWTVFQYGPDSPVSLMGQELWLLLIQLAANIKRAEEGIERVRRPDNKELIEDFLESGDRLFNRFKSLLRACEAPVIKALKKNSESSGVEFIKTLFSRNKELTRTEKFMTRVRLWNLRYDANCLEILLNLSQ